MLEDETPEGELPEIDPQTLDSEEQTEPEPTAIEDEPISLVDASELDDSPGASKIHTFGSGVSVVQKSDYKRPVNVDGTGATRCKLFHSKIGPGPLEHLEKQINEWLDAEEVEIKFVTKTVGVMEGKRAEPNLLVMIWY